MSHNINSAPDSRQFLERVAALPDAPSVSLDAVLAPSIDKEAELRRFFAQDRKNSYIADPYVGLVSVFEAPDSIRVTRARDIKDEEDLMAKHIFPVEADKRRADGTPCMVQTLEDFQKNWTIFTEGSLSQLTDWNNVVAAGGSVLGCLLPLSDKAKESKRNIRKFYHSEAYPTSDVDLFLWGLNAEQAEAKINQIYEAVRDSIPWDVTCVRTKHAISIHSQYPYRSIQIVLRLYQSPAEILAGFDVDAPCVAYDGTRVLANPRSIIAMMRQSNTVDITRRSPSYEIRLAKYASRGFEIYVPDLKRGEIDPTIFERSINRITGLARLLVLEKLADPQARQSYLELRRHIRSRVNHSNMYRARNRHTKEYKNDLKGEEIGGLEFNDYDLVTLHIPYGPGWTAKRIEKLVYQTDLGTNSSFNPRNKGRRLHRHPAFFGIMKECIEDLCEYCPEPKTKEEKELQEEEDKAYVRGRISFIEEDPGRQSMTGSFNPIDVGEWSEQAYLGATERFFSAIALSDRESVKRMIAENEVDVNRRDHVGRTALHVAILCGVSEICSDLIEAGARMTARIVDGRTALHLAAQMNLPEVVERLLEKSCENEAKGKEAEEAEAKETGEEDKMDEDEDGKEDSDDEERASSEDDWSSEDEEAKKKNAEEAAKPDEDSAIPEDNAEEPDVFDVNAPDWDFAFTPLCYAILSGAKRVVQLLLNAGADPKLPSKANNYQSPIFHPLSVTVITDDEEKELDIIDQLVKAGASSSQADNQLYSIFHSIVCSGRTRLVERILQVDPKANSAINVPCNDGRGIFTYPLVTAITKGHYAIAALLIGYGAKVTIHPDDFQKIKNMTGQTIQPYMSSNTGNPHILDYLRELIVPAEAAIANCTYMLKLLVKLRAQVSVPINRVFHDSRYNPEAKKSILDWVNAQIDGLKETLKEASIAKPPPVFEAPESIATFQDYRRVMTARVRSLRDSQNSTATKQPKDNKNTLMAISYYEEMKVILEKCSAKTYNEIYPDEEEIKQIPYHVPVVFDEKSVPPRRTHYDLLTGYYGTTPVLPHLLDKYDALFEACWTGDNACVEELCLPRKGSKADAVPIAIAVSTEQFTESGTQYQDGTHTPLSVAISNRKWDTARLILAIATAQYERQDNVGTKSVKPVNFDLDDKMDDDDPDSDSEVMEDEEDPDPREIGVFTDLANRTSAVRSTASPEILIDFSISERPNRLGTKIIGRTILGIACADNDLEAFANVCDLMKLLSKPKLPSGNDLSTSIRNDCPEILDEIIRRTGLGIDLHRLDDDEEDEDEQSAGQGGRKTSKLYLGLTVHGKKRKDLANRNIHKNWTQPESPLLWRAIRVGAKKIIEYLSGPKPLAAYLYYAQTSSDEHALALRKHPLEKELPALLGITPNSRNETALSASIISFNGNNEEMLDIMKHVLAHFPAQASAYLHLQLKFLRLNNIMLATSENCDIPIIEYLLSSGVVANGSDRRGYNVFHYVCRNGNAKLLEYYINKLPREVTSHLLKQVSREGGNTPLMLAVKLGNIDSVEKLFRSNLSAVKDTVFIRDKKGSLPVHVAVRAGFANIASLIINSGGLDILHSENAVGETPLETATVLWLSHATRNAFNGGVNNLLLQPSGVYTSSVPPNLKKMAEEIKLLKEVLSSFDRSGKLAVKLKKALESFVPYLTRKYEELSEAGAANVNSMQFDIGSMDNEKCKSELNDPVETFKVVSSFAFASPGKRQLVHLIDVQISVQNSLEIAESEVGKQRRQIRRLEAMNEGGIQDEEENADEESDLGMVRFGDKYTSDL